MKYGDSDVTSSLGILAASSGGRMNLHDQVAQWFFEWRLPIYRSLLTAGADPAEAEELTQEAFLRAFRYLHKGKAIETPRLWLFRVAHNLRLDHLRTRHISAGTPMDTPDWRPDPEQAAQHRERLERVHSAMAKLTELQRSCLNLRAEGFLNREIAGILGIGLSSVADALRRGLNRLAKEEHE
jgi:RNA polymerase sigma-70 factor (ECF subfamily)